MDFRVFSRNISENMHARCVREDTKQALKENLQADGVQSRQTLFVRYCPGRFFADAKKHTLPIIIELSVFVNPYFSVSGDLLYEYEISQECYIMFTWILAEKPEKGLTGR